MDVSAEGYTWGDVGEVLDYAVVVDGASSVEDDMCPDGRIGLHDNSGGDQGPRPELDRIVHMRLRVNYWPPRAAEPFRQPLSYSIVPDCEHGGIWLLLRMRKGTEHGYSEYRAAPGFGIVIVYSDNLVPRGLGRSDYNLGVATSAENCDAGARSHKVVPWVS